jgi:hypothetical protein
MIRFIRSNLVLAGGVALLALFASVGAFAAPDVTPWPDPFEGASGVELPEDVPDDVTLPELPDEAQGGEDGEGEGEGDPPEVQVENGDGVPLDSPACAGDPATPNPHDTDGDGDGCREVETEDGMKNLPDPAADGIDRARENRDAALDNIPDNAGPGNDLDVENEVEEDEEEGDGGPPLDVPGGPPQNPNIPEGVGPQ